jgi:hypothetical protein
MAENNGANEIINNNNINNIINNNECGINENGECINNGVA